MVKVVSVKFKQGGKAYYFDPKNLTLSKGDEVIVETSKGQEFVTVCAPVEEVEDDKVVLPLMPVLRKATEADLRQLEYLDSKRADTFKIVREKIAESGLNMKPVGCEFSFDGNRVTIFFTAPERVDFRELIRELSSALHMRIELRQINVREEIKLVGTIGPCGRECCCAKYLSEPVKTSVKMAKNQNLALNPAKIAGMCGRLMCCLAFENDYYSEVQKQVPRIGGEVLTPSGKGIAVNIDMFKLIVKVRIENGDAVSYKDYGVDEISFVRGGVRLGRVDLAEEKVKPAAEPYIGSEEQPVKEEQKGEDKAPEKRGKRDFKNKPKRQNENRGEKRESLPEKPHADDGAEGAQKNGGRDRKRNRNRNGKNFNRPQGGERKNTELEKTNQGLGETNNGLVKTNKLKVAKKPKKFEKTGKNS